MSYLDKLKQITAWDIEPELTEEELEEFLAASALEDAAGLSPLHEEWTPTYDLNAAASAAWLVKAARSAQLVEVDPPGSGLFSSRVFENCRAMARIYAAKRKFTTAAV
jgi:hypothetical protein